MAAPPRRRKIGHRRKVEDEGEDGPEHMDLEDDSMSEVSAPSDNDAADDSDTSNIDEASPTSPTAKKAINGSKKPAGAGDKPAPASTAAKGTGDTRTTDTEVMMNGMTLKDQSDGADEVHFDDATAPQPRSSTAPVVVSSASAQQEPTPEAPGTRRRQEHEDYKRRRDADPAFVPNRGAFFMHDHRHPGPAANGFRPFGRGRGRGGRGGAFGGHFAPINQHHHLGDPTTSSAWTHDMHESIADSGPRRSRNVQPAEGPANGNGVIRTCEVNATPINRTMSTEKHIGNAQVRVFLPMFKAPIIIPGMPVKQYTKLPDHRPPLRRDKAVRISLPGRPPRYIFPAIDRSFIFIPRAMRPNQQRVRGKGRSGFGGSVGGFSRRTSVFGGSYVGSMYSPSVAVSRRSSIVHDRDYMFSPTGSVVSRAAIPTEHARPVVRLPPAPRSEVPVAAPTEPAVLDRANTQEEMAKQTQQLQIPALQENRQVPIPMHQPRPQKNISVADIEPPLHAQNTGPFQQAFHQQVPAHVNNIYARDSHSRQASYPSQHSTGTPLSQIPERAIHAAPFQPHGYAQQPYYAPHQPYPPQQPGYYYQPGYPGPAMVPAPQVAPAGPVAGGMPPPFVPSAPQGPGAGYNPQQHHADPSVAGNVAGGQAPAQGPSLVAQEVNGMVYYYDASQMAPANAYPSYGNPQGFQPSVMGMGGMVTPSPDGFYYPQPGPGMYYPQ